MLMCSVGCSKRVQGEQPLTIGTVAAAAQESITKRRLRLADESAVPTPCPPHIMRDLQAAKRRTETA